MARIEFWLDDELASVIEDADKPNNGRAVEMRISPLKNEMMRLPDGYHAVDSKGSSLNFFDERMGRRRKVRIAQAKRAAPYGDQFIYWLRSAAACRRQVYGG